jgi:hypothetical protein
MLAAAEDSDSEFMLKLEPDSDEDEMDGRRSRSASWTTATDPKTPREYERLLSYNTVKIEGLDIIHSTTDVKVILDHLDSSPPPGFASPLQEELAPDWHEEWMTQDDLDDLAAVDNPLLMKLNPLLDVKIEPEEPASVTLPSRTHVGRSSSTPLPITPSMFSGSGSLSPTMTAVDFDDADDIEILGPDTIGAEAFTEDNFGKCHREGDAPLHARFAPLPLRATASEPSPATGSPVRDVTIDGKCMHVINLFGRSCIPRSKHFRACSGWPCFMEAMRRASCVPPQLVADPLQPSTSQ